MGSEHTIGKSRGERRVFLSSWGAMHTTLRILPRIMPIFKGGKRGQPRPRKLRRHTETEASCAGCGGRDGAKEDQWTEQEAERHQTEEAMSCRSQQSPARENGDGFGRAISYSASTRFVCLIEANGRESGRYGMISGRVMDCPSQIR